MAVISGDGVLSHCCRGARDLTRSTAFYDGALAPLGVRNSGPSGDSPILYGKDKPALLVRKPGKGAAGPRGHLPGAYAACLRDPAGNNIRARHFTAA